MQVAKWGDSLAVRLPAAVVEALGLKEGADARSFGVARRPDRAGSILAGGGMISVQVLNELANVARRKMRMAWPELQAFLAPFLALLRVEPLTIATHETGLALVERYALSTYDAMIAASALNATCDILWSEDMQDGVARGGGLSGRNPST